jgi:hypothetical protein
LYDDGYHFADSGQTHHGKFHLNFPRSLRAVSTFSSVNLECYRKEA